jgi:transcriptional regulator with XRE-family HTH domain
VTLIRPLGQAVAVGDTCPPGADVIRKADAAWEAAMGVKQIKETRKLSKPEHFRLVREALELTQAEMAQMLGYGSRTRIAEVEAGTRKPNESVVRLLHAYLEGYRPQDWPQKGRTLRIAEHQIEPPPIRIRVRESEPVVEHFRIARPPATPAPKESDA